MIRRQFVALFATFLGSGAAIPSLSADSKISGVGIEKQALRDLIRDPASARTLGRAYISQLTQTADHSDVPKKLVEDFERSVGNRGTGETLVTAYEKARKADFLQGDIVELDGWQLSRTEVTTCALFSLESLHVV